MKRYNDHSKKSKKQKAAKAYLKLLNSSLLAASLTAGIAGQAGAVHAESPAAPVMTQAGAQLPVYEGDSLLHFRNMLSNQQNNSITGGELIPPNAANTLVRIVKNAVSVTERLSTVNVADDEADTVSYEIVRYPEQGTLTLLNSETGSYAFTPPAGFEGDITFDYIEKQDEGSTAPITVTLRVVGQTPPTDRSQSNGTDQLISATHSSDQTPNAASLQTAKSEDGSVRSATIRLLADGVKTAAGQAKDGDTISIVTPDLTGTDQVQAVLPGDALTALADKHEVLDIQTGAAGTRIPSEAFDLGGLAARTGVNADQIELQLTVTKESSASVPASLPSGSTALSAPYTVKLTAALPDGSQVDVPSYNARYATLTIPLDHAVSDYSHAAGVIIENGQAYPVPVRFTADGQAEIHTTRNGTFMLVQQSAPDFSDISDHWAADAIQALAGKGVVEGTNGAFEPDAQITRAEYASALVRALGLETADSGTGSGAFNDVAEGAWYTSAVNSAVDAGLFKGIGADLFAPDQVITREQMAAVLVRAVKAYHLDLPENSDGAELQQFSDVTDISAWAKDDMAEAVRIGLIRGAGDDRIESQQSGTRSQSAVMLLQLLQRAGLMN